MANENELVDFVELKTNLPEVTEQIERAREETERLTLTQKALAAGLTDPKVLENLRILEQMTQRNRDLLTLERQRWQLASRSDAIASGDYLRRHRAAVAMKAEEARIEREEARARLAIRQEQFNSGSFIANARANATLRHDEQRQQHQEQTAFRQDQLGSGTFAATERERQRWEMEGRRVQMAEDQVRLGMRRERLQSGEFVAESRGLIGFRHDVAGQQHQEQTAVRRDQLDSGEFRRHQRDRMRWESESARLAREESRVSLSLRRERLRSGEFGRDASDRIRLERQTRLIEDAERRAENLARYGRVGGGAVNAMQSPWARGAMGLATAGASAYTGMAMRGFSGTVEMARLNWSLEQLSRSLAGSLIPAMDTLRESIDVLRKWYDKLPGGSQRAIGYGAVGVGALGAASMASRAFLGMGLVQGAATAASMFRSGPGASGAIRPSTGLPAMVPGIGLGAASAAALPLAAATAGLYGTRDRGGREGVWQSMGFGAKTSGYIDSFAGGGLNRLRDRGPEWLQRGISGVPFGAMGSLTGLNDIQMAGSKKGDKPMIADAGFEQIGGAFERSIVKADYLGLGMAEKPEESKDYMKEIYELIKGYIEGMEGGGKTEAPPHSSTRK